MYISHLNVFPAMGKSFNNFRGHKSPVWTKKGVKIPMKTGQKCFKTGENHRSRYGFDI